MIGAIEDAIIARIKATDLGYTLKKLVSYGGEYADTLDRVVKDFPMVALIFAGAQRADTHNRTFNWLIMCGANNMRNEAASRKGADGKVGSYQIAEDVADLLEGQTLGIDAIDEIQVNTIEPLVNDKAGQQLASIYGVRISMRVSRDTDIDTSGLDDFNFLHTNWDVPPHGNVSTELPADATADATDDISTAEVTPPTVPPVVDDLVAVAGDGQVALAWSAIATRYLVQFKKKSNVQWLDGGVSGTNAKTITGLENGTEYEFRVWAENAAGMSGPSNVATATPEEQDNLSLAAVNAACILDYSAQIAESYDGTSQVMNNLVPGSAEPATWLGVDGGATGDPIFEGTPGTPAGAFVFNGNMYLQQQSLTDFVKKMHRSDNTQPWTVTLNLLVKAGDSSLVSTKAVGAAGLFLALMTSGRVLRVRAYDAAGNQSQLFQSNQQFVENTDALFSFSWNPVTRSYVFKAHSGTVQTGTASSFSNTQNAAFPLTLGADADGNNTLGVGINNGAKIYNFAVFNAALTESEIDAIHAAIIARRT